MNQRLRQGRGHMGTMEYSDEYLLERLRAASRALPAEQPLSARAFDELEGFAAAQLYYLRFGSWIDALFEAGLIDEARAAQHRSDSRPNGFGDQQYNEAQVRHTYRRIRELVGRPPTIAEWQKHRIPGQEPSADTVRVRYSGWTVFLEEMTALDHEWAVL